MSTYADLGASATAAPCMQFMHEARRDGDPVIDNVCH